MGLHLGNITVSTTRQRTHGYTHNPGWVSPLLGLAPQEGRKQRGLAGKAAFPASDGSGGSAARGRNEGEIIAVAQDECDVTSSPVPSALRRNLHELLSLHSIF